MFQEILPLIFLFILGYFLKKKGIISSRDSKTVGNLLSKVVLPALIIKSLATVELKANLLYLPLSALCVVISLTLIGYLIAKGLKLEKKTKGAFITTFPTFEGGAIGYPFMLLVFGDLGLSRIVLFDFAQAIYLFTVIYFLSCSFGNTNSNFKSILFKIIQTPLIWSIFIGLGLNLLGWQFPLLIDTLGIISQSFIFLMFMLVAIAFEFELSAFKLSSLSVVLKTGIGGVLGWLFSQLFGLSGVEQVAVMVGSTLPPSLLTLIFTEENFLDTKFVANFISLGFVFALVFLPILANLF